MLKDSHAFSSFSVKDLEAAKQYYGEVLGIECTDDWMGLQLQIAGGSNIFVYQKDDHQPASYTVLNFPVDDIDAAIDALGEKGILMERYDDLNLPGAQDEKGVLRGKAVNQGPDIAWFKDPSGNILSVLCN